MEAGGGRPARRSAAANQSETLREPSRDVAISPLEKLGGLLHRHEATLQPLQPPVVQQKKIARAQQILGAWLIEDDLAVDSLGKAEGDAGGEVGLHGPGDELDARTLCCKDEKDAGGASTLREAKYLLLELCPLWSVQGQAQIGKFIDHNYDIRAGNLKTLGPELAVV